MHDILLIIRSNMENTTRTKPYVLTSTDTHFYLHAKKTHFKQPSFLRINRLTSKVNILSQQRFEKQTHTGEKRTVEQLWLLLGILIVNQQPYLAVAGQADAVATLGVEKVYCIRDVNFIPFKHKYLYRVIDQTENEKILQEMRQNILKDNFYFCLQRDLTLTWQKTAAQRPSERKYFWNEELLKMFTFYQLPACWRIPLVQGFVSELYCENEYFSFYYCVISRRSKHMSGTRYHSRGIDDNFNAANFVQSEEIFVCLNYLFTHVALRGSAPVYWSQDGFGEPVKFRKTDEQNMLVIEKHFDLLKQEYQSHVVAINLLSNVKESERDLKNRYEFYLRRAIPNEPYIYFDFNEQIRNKENAVNQIIDRFIEDHIQVFAPSQNFFCLDRYTNKLYTQQSMTPRINCLDCLDRSNVIMSRISLVFLRQVEKFVNSHTNMVEKKLTITKEYIEEVVNLWAEVGNRISTIYCGTESVATHLTKQEEGSFFSFIKESFRSIGRYYHANVNDAFKQTCIDFLLAKKEQNSKTKYFDDNIVKTVLEQVKYCEYEEATAYCLTWNCNMVDPERLSPRDMEKLFNFPLEKTDILVVCLQEMVELNSYNVLLGNNEGVLGRWRAAIEKYLADLASKRVFVYLTSYDMVGIATFVFISGALFNRVQQHEWFDIKTGFKNNLGNKGAVLLFLQIDSTYLTLTNCHLAAGENASAERLQDIEYIHNDALNERSKRRLFDKSEYKFFIGDMNFRLQAKNESVREILYTIEKQDSQKKLTKSDMQTYLQSLLQKDEYYLNNLGGSLGLYSEGTIYFLPTYKYVKKQKIYDTKRTPSWCDRILFHSHDPKKLVILKYWDIDCYQSDHKPVCGAFKLLLKREDPDRKRKLLQLYMESED